MFLKDLYLHSKKLFIVVTLFVTTFLYINYKQGIIISPIYEYGMYSGYFHLQDTLVAYHIYVNDKIVDPAILNLAERDLVFISPISFYMQAEHNDINFLMSNNIFNKMHIGKIIVKSNFENNTLEKDFLNWYRKLLQKVFSIAIKRFAIYKQSYIYQDNNIKVISSPQILYHFDTNQ